MSFHGMETDRKPAPTRGATKPRADRARGPSEQPARFAAWAEPDRPADHVGAGHSFGRMRVHAEEHAAGPTRQTTLPRRSGTVTTPAPHVMEDEGSTGEASVEGGSLSIELRSVDLAPGRVNEWGDLDGDLTSNVQPHTFTNGGRTGRAAVHWGGGGGGMGNQGVGTITLTAPVYEGRDPPAAGGAAQAWIQTGTGRAQVTRSYTGVLVGANGPDYYITASAAARVDVHEGLHVSSSRSIHDARIVPLEARIAQHEGEPNAMSHGSTRAEAIAALRTFVDWNTAITNFSTDDTTANQPGGTVDTTDMARADFIQNLGPRRVRGVRYANYIDTPRRRGT